MFLRSNPGTSEGAIMRPASTAWAAIFLLLAACGPSPGEPRRCQEASECAAGSFCRGGRCAASSPPLAVASAPAAGPLASHTVLRFDGSRSSDPDPGDQVADWAWSARAAGAGCEPYPASGSGQTVDLVFGCAGAFEVELVVKDTTGLASAPAVLPVTVELSADVPSVEMGPDLSVDHGCQGSPLLCRALPPAGAPELTLSATARSPLSAAFTYDWSVAPPAVAAAPRVTLDDPTSPSPRVRIETEGTAIAGDYLFTVRATDEYHLVAVGQQRISVGNRPPEVAGGGPVVAMHSFDAAGRRFLSSGSVAASATDPDGDPVVPVGFAASHAGDGGGTFDVVASGWSASFAIAVPYSKPSDGAFLIGGPGLSRTIAFAAADANGARASASWDVQVANRLPHVAGPPGPVAVGHSFDAAGSRYLASADLLLAADEDGDPIVQAGPTGDALCATIPEVVGGGMVRVECALAYAGTPGLRRLLGTHPVDVVVGDPWSSLSPGTASVTIGNRPPRIAASSASVATACGTAFCCRPSVEGCLALNAHHGAGSAQVMVPAIDDDGDPVQVGYGPPPCVQVTPQGLTCVPGSCGTVQASLCEETPACGAPQYAVAVTASDGVDSATGSLTLDPGCVPPI
jgi:hypothetical protein